jgi:hypothetical protein
MKKLTQKLVLSVITMALVVVALGTSTFAWFTLQNSATVGTFEAQVTAGEGIEISLGQGTATQTINYSTETAWYTAMPSSVIQSFIDSKYPSFSFDNVTGGTTGASFNDQLGDSVTSGYISFTLYFRSRTASLPIALNNVVLGGDSAPWTVNSNVFTHVNDHQYGIDPDGQVTYDTTMQVAASSAARVAVNGSEPAVIVQAPEAVSSTAYTTAVYNSHDLPSVSYDITALAVGPNAVGAASYERANGVTRTFTAAPVIADAITNAALPYTYNDGTNDLITNGRKVATIGTSLLDSSEYYGTSVTVTIWIEGWDADTFDAIFETMLTVSLGFTEYQETIVTP